MNSIYYFSGTNNTKVIAQAISNKWNEKGEECSAQSVVPYIKGEQTINNDFTRIGIGYAVSAFSMPDIIVDFIKLLPRAKGREAFIFQTCGDVIDFNLSGLIKGRKLLEMKGYKVVYEKNFVMNSNFYMSYSDLFSKQLYSKNLEKIDYMVDLMAKGEKRQVSFNPLMCELAYGIHYMEERFGARRFGKGLTTDENCTMCGKCVRECPSDNIHIEDGKIVFHNQCMMCMKCVYSCPQKAIYPRKYKSVVLSEGYNVEAVVYDNELGVNGYELEEPYKKFQEYFDNIEK